VARLWNRIAAGTERNDARSRVTLVGPFAGTPDDPQRAARRDEAGHVPVVPSNPDHRAGNVGHDSGPWLSSHLLGLDRDAITDLDQSDPSPAGTARSTPTCARRQLLRNGSALGRLERGPRRKGDVDGRRLHAQERECFDVAAVRADPSPVRESRPRRLGRRKASARDLDRGPRTAGRAHGLGSRVDPPGEEHAGTTRAGPTSSAAGPSQCGQLLGPGRKSHPSG